jgi:hypothetical protein
MSDKYIPKWTIEYGDGRFGKSVSIFLDEKFVAVGFGRTQQEALQRVRHSVPELPDKISGYFLGEMMTCYFCQKQQHSDPNIVSGWYVLQLDDKPFYVCPECIFTRGI